MLHLLPLFVALGFSTQNRVAPSAERDLTDKERHLSETYVNEALASKKMNEECSKLESGICRGQGKTFFLGVESDIVDAVAKAYGVLLGKMSISSKGKDFCAMIGAGTEALGLFIQQLEEKKTITSSDADSQKKRLQRAVKAHKVRARSAKIQAVGWTGVSGCYLAKHLNGQFAIKGWNIAKLAASGLLSVYYFSKIDQHEKHARQVQAIADKMPGPGECNPITENDCYCSLAQNQNDPVHCTPELHDKKIAASSVRTPCADGNMRADPKCQCDKTNSCLDQALASKMQVGGIGKTFLDSPEWDNIRSLNRGELKSSALSSVRGGKNASLQRLFERIKKDIPPLKSAPNQAQRKQVEAMAKMGIPHTMGAHLAAQSPNPQFKNKLLRQGGRTVVARQGRTNKSPSGGRILTFGGRGLKGSRKQAARKGFNLSKYLPKKKHKSKSSGKILTFQDRALSSAEISRREHQDIFRIISKRYLLWASKKPDTK